MAKKMKAYGEMKWRKRGESAGVGVSVKWRRLKQRMARNISRQQHEKKWQRHGSVANRRRNENGGGSVSSKANESASMASIEK
jgi:hypothetical protein